MKVKELYKPFDLSPGTTLEACPVCGSEASLWQYSEDFINGPIHKVIMCSNGERIVSQDTINEGCLLYMPPQDFYRSRFVEAVNYWNDYAKALNAMRRKRNWNRVSAYRTGERE